MGRNNYRKNLEHHRQRKKGYYQKNKDRLINKSRRAKLDAIKYKGGCCSVCGGTFHPSAFDFHHMNPAEKEYEIGRLMRSPWKKRKTELDKCVLICANCHRTLHNKDW